MRRWGLTLLLLGALLAFATGCSGDKDRGINKKADRPVSDPNK